MAATVELSVQQPQTKELPKPPSGEAKPSTNANVTAGLNLTLDMPKSGIATLATIDTSQNTASAGLGAGAPEAGNAGNQPNASVGESGSTQTDNQTNRGGRVEGRGQMPPVQGGSVSRFEIGGQETTVNPQFDKAREEWAAALRKGPEADHSKSESGDPQRIRELADKVSNGTASTPSS